MTTLSFLYLVLKVIATVLSILLSLRELGKHIKRKKKQANSHRQKG